MVAVGRHGSRATSLHRHQGQCAIDRTLNPSFTAAGTSLAPTRAIATCPIAAACAPTCASSAACWRLAARAARPGSGAAAVRAAPTAAASMQSGRQRSGRTQARSSATATTCAPTRGRTGACAWRCGRWQVVSRMFWLCHDCCVILLLQVLELLLSHAGGLGELWTAADVSATIVLVQRADSMELPKFVHNS